MLKQYLKNDIVRGLILLLVAVLLWLTTTRLPVGYAASKGWAGFIFAIILGTLLITVGVYKRIKNK